MMDSDSTPVRDQINLVDFVVAGAQKSGTRALCHFLFQHPEIGLPKSDGKETHFFDLRIKNSIHGDYTKYHRLYEPESLRKVTGDITPVYMFHATALQDIRIYNPAMKVIVILRDPVERAFSQWVMLVKKGITKRGFSASLITEVTMLRRHQPRPHFTFMQRGFYGRQIARLFSIFPPEQCLILKTDDLLNNHRETMLQIYRFLAVKLVDPPKAEMVHARTNGKIPVTASVFLRLLFHRDIRRLERLLDWDCREWRSW